MKRAVALALACLVASAGHHAVAAPSGDPLRARQWGLDQLHVEAAWRATRGAGVTVAVIDSGVDFGHPDLRGALLAGRDFTGSGTVQDDCGHGTEVAGVIAARRGNGLGVTGVAPAARILPLKDGAGCTVDLTAMTTAIRYAADHGARVINISQATQPVVGDAAFVALFQEQVQAAVDHAWSRGALVVAGAGNSDLPLCSYPAALRHVICVGAVTNDRSRAYYSQGDATGSVDFVVAPGGGQSADLVADGGIWTTSAELPAPPAGGTPTERGYASVSGTSFATPFVAGVAALLFSRGLPVDQVRARLLTTTTDLGPPGRDPVYGDGEIDAAGALRATD